MATVSHKLELPDGTVPHRAKVAVRLIASIDPFDTEEGHVAGQYSIGGITRPPIDSSGTWTLNLTPNASIIPAGTVYEVVEQLPGFDEVTLYFSVPNGGGQVQDLLTDFPGTLPSGATAAETARATAAELALTNSKVDAVTAGDGTITIGGTTRAPTVAVNVIGEGKVTNLVADLAAKITTATLGQALGPASLDGAGKLLTTQLPSLAITDVSVVASVAAMLAIAGAHQGSVAVRTDIQNQAFMHNAGTAGTLADWTEIGFGDVLSVNGSTGAVTITAAGLGALVAASNLSDLPSPTTAKANLGLSNVDNTSDVNKPVSTAQATADALRIPLTQKGAASGVGTLDSGGHQPLSELSSQVGSGSPPSPNWMLVQWTLAESYVVTAVTRDANEAITTATVVWPDGATGTFTTDTASTSFPGAIDAYHVTYVYGAGPTTKTITQAAVTRDAGGAVTAQPALTVT